MVATGVLKCPAILSIIGWHAKESPAQIVSRKADDISRAGITFWFYQSWKARTDALQQFSSTFANPTVYFLEGSTVATGTSDAAIEMSHDRVSWKPLPKGIGRVTGKLKSGTGLALGELVAVQNKTIDLWDYTEHPEKQPLRFQLGASTACVIPSEGQMIGMKSRFRNVVAVGRLIAPYAVYLR